MTPVRALVLLAAAVLAGCGTAETPAFQTRFLVFGTWIDVSLHGVPDERAHELAAAIEADFQRQYAEWHPWQPSRLGEVNAALAAGRPAQVPDSMLDMVRRSFDFHAQSEGRFDPALGGLVALWGFYGDGPPSGPMPSRAALAAWLKARPRYADLTLDGHTLTTRNRAVRLDFNAIGEGMAIDRAIERLRAAGVANAIINGGGDLRAIGRHGHRPWRVGIRHPQNGGVLAALDVEGDEAVFTSGNYARFRADEGVRHGHVLDPRNAWPVEGVTSVTVIHRSGLEADAAATTLVIAGARDWHRIARAMGVRHVLLVTEDGTAHMDPGMWERLRFETRPARIEVSPPL